MRPPHQLRRGTPLLLGGWVNMIDRRATSWDTTLVATSRQIGKLQVPNLLRLSLWKLILGSFLLHLILQKHPPDWWLLLIEEITPTTRRWGEMLVLVTRLGVSSFLPFPCSIDDKMLVKLMVEASFANRDQARGESLLTEDSKSNYFVQIIWIAGRHKHLVSNYFVTWRLRQ